MTGKSKGALALAIVGVLGLSVGTAEAGWRDTARKHGAGYYIDTYVDKHVTQDNKYKGSKHDKWSGDYYNTKTGKWTGKKDYNGEYSSKSSSSASANSGAASGAPKTAKKSSVQTVSKKPDIGGSTAAGQKPKSDVELPSYSAAGNKTSEVYGPPMPEQIASADAQN